MGNIAFRRDVTSIRAYATFVSRANKRLSLHLIYIAIYVLVSHRGHNGQVDMLLSQT